MRALVRLIDALLRLHEGLFEFSQNSDCLLRLQYRLAPHTVIIGDEVITKGDPVLAIHAWNEHLPKLPPVGADLKWALRLRSSVIFSFKELALWMHAAPRCREVQAVYASSALFSFSDHTGGVKMMQRLGFTVLPYHRPFGRFGEFWENLFSWWMMWAFNDVTLNSRKFWRLQRTEIWMTKADFLRRYHIETSHN